MVKKRLGEMLLEAGIIDAHKLQAALGHQRKWGGRLGQALVDLQLATEPQIVSALSQKFGYQVVPPQALEGGPMLESALRLMPREFAARHNLIPFAIDSSTIWVAMSDPANIAVVDEIRFRTGRRVQIAVAGDRQIAEAVRRHYFADQTPQAVDAIALEADSGSPFSETVVEQFGGGSAAAFEDFFAQSAESPQVPELAGPSPLLDDPFALPMGSAPPAAARADPGVSAVDLQDLLPEEISHEAAAPAGAAQATAREESISIELPLVEVPPESSSPGGNPVLEALDRLARGQLAPAEVVKPVQMLAALVRLLLQKKLITEEEFLAEVGRK